VTLRIEPYKKGSKSAKALARRTGILRATAKQVQKHGTFDTVLNWGNSERRFNDAEYINDPEAVAIASDKLRSARRFGESHIAQPEYTTDKAVAEDWYNAGDAVCTRRYLRASGGRGLTVTSGGQQGVGDTEDTPGGLGIGDRRHGRGLGNGNGGRGILDDAPLYTKYVKKADEYRIHVFDGEVIDIQQKRKRQEVPNDEVNYQIRNACNGWVFCRDNVHCPAECLALARRAVSTLGLDFGAVDIGYNRSTTSAVVYEVNTAPGLEGTTLDKYHEAITARIPAISGGIFAKRRRG
jgi:glutathione synthase/RimK-type ligase-like ATP-grasp enzyme